MDEIIEVGYRRRVTGQIAILKPSSDTWFNDEDWVFELQDDINWKGKGKQFKSIAEATARIERDRSWDIMYIRYLNKETKRTRTVNQSRIPAYNRWAGWS